MKDGDLHKCMHWNGVVMAGVETLGPGDNN